MIVSYQYTHYGLHGYTHVLQGLANSTCWNSCINQYTIKLITKVITVSAATTTKTAKIQFHQCSVERGQRYITGGTSDVPEQKTQTTIYPNPTHGKLTVMLENTE